MTLTKQVALFLNDNVADITFDETGTSGNTYINKLPEFENSIGIFTKAGSPILSKNVGTGSLEKGIKLQVRGTKNGLETEELANKIYNVLTSFSGLLTPGGDCITICKAQQSSPNYIGTDVKGNVMMTINYKFLLVDNNVINNN